MISSVGQENASRAGKPRLCRSLKRYPGEYGRAGARKKQALEQTRALHYETTVHGGSGSCASRRRPKDASAEIAKPFAGAALLAILC